MNEILGLPAHPLVVHIAVAFVPLAALGVLLTAFWPAARAKLGVAVVVIALTGTVAAYLATQSGESLEERVDTSEQVEEHAELGDTGLAAAAAVLVAAVAVTGFGMYERRRTDVSTVAVAGADDVTTVEPHQMTGARMAVGVVAVVLATLGTAQIYRIGHSGAKATWGDLGQEQEGSDGG